ncbi:DUF4190 domain-containing protein [Rothia uropygialis]|uniref:DUF4190 domain-containing protein n=1 Tax=Kocuria sp. 36 TaxID=1415402 RepID=UPI00101BE0DE|nr:DUF4190 domain-containing protein [Kocuria sp. 36]
MTNNPSSENHEPNSEENSSAPRFGQRDPQSSDGIHSNGGHEATGEQPQYGNYPSHGSSVGRQPDDGNRYGQQERGYQPLPHDNGQQPYNDQYNGQPRYGAPNNQAYPMNDSGQPQYQPNNYGRPNYQQYPSRVGERPNGWGMGLAALICGIASVVLCWLVLPGIAGIVAIVLGIVAVRKLGKTQGASKAMPIIGIVLGAIGVILSVIVGVLFAIGLSVANDAAQQCGGYSSANSAEFEQCVDSYIQSNY